MALAAIPLAAHLSTRGGPEFVLLCYRLRLPATNLNDLVHRRPRGRNASWSGSATLTPAVNISLPFSVLVFLVLIGVLHCCSGIHNIEVRSHDESGKV